MKSPLILFSSFLVFTFVVTANASIEGVCKAAASRSPNVNYALCVKSLRAAPGSSRADANGLAVIATNLAMGSASSTKSKIPAMISNTRDHKFNECLKTCLDVYEELVGSLKDSVTALKAKRLDDAKTYLSASMDDSDTCEQSFTDAKLRSPLAAEDQYSFRMTDIALAITAGL